MAIKDVVKHITDIHGYRVTSNYWSRVGMVIKRYGEDVVKEAIEHTQPAEIPLTRTLNIIEKKCQFLLENGTGSIDDLVNDILNSSGEEE